MVSESIDWDISQQPLDPKAVGMVTIDVFEAVAIFGVIEALVFDLPTTLGTGKQGARADLGRREIGQPLSFVKSAGGWPRHRSLMSAINLGLARHSTHAADSGWVWSVLLVKGQIGVP